jgi:hypothetical protein
MNGSVRFGIWIGASTGGTIADLTIDSVNDHGIIANAGANNLLVHNVRIVDSGDQFVKSNPDANGVGNSHGIVEYSVFEYRTTDNDNYTNGVDVHGGDGWIVRYNLFKNILSPAGQGLAGPAVLMWNGSKNSVIEGNTFINVARGVALGLQDKADGFDHQGGVIENNFFYRDANLASDVDVPIYVADSPGTKIYHNTLIARGSYPNAIEYRFASSTGIDIKNNLTDGVIVARDAASATAAGNMTSATLALFVNPAAADLHLIAGASPINQGVAIPGFTFDFDGQSRDAQLDVGADEFVAGNPPPDTTAPTISGVGTTNLTSGGVTIQWMTNEAADTQIEYGTTTGYGSASPLNIALASSHSVSLSGLVGGTTYHFRVKSHDAAGNLAVSGDLTFTTTAAPAPLKRIIEDGNAGNSLVGSWRRVTGKGYANDIRLASKGNGSTYSTWTFTSLPSAQYQVWATWKISSVNATNAPFALYDGSAARLTARVNQRLTPPDLSADGALWKLLGTVTINSGKLVVKLTNSANGQVVADAIRIDRVLPVGAAAAQVDLSPQAVDLLYEAAKKEGNLQALLG